MIYTPTMQDLAVAFNNEIFFYNQFRYRGPYLQFTPPITSEVAKAISSLGATNGFYWVEGSGQYWGIGGSLRDVYDLDEEDNEEIQTLILHASNRYPAQMSYVRYEGTTFIKSNYSVISDSEIMPVLFWPDATEITLTDSNVNATIFAPNAIITLENTFVAGNVWGLEVSESARSVPEPASLLVLCVTLLPKLIGRNKRRK